MGDSQRFCVPGDRPQGASAEACIGDDRPGQGPLFHEEPSWAGGAPVAQRSVLNPA